jgi:hypothetical protein
MSGLTAENSLTTSSTAFETRRAANLSLVLSVGIFAAGFLVTRQTQIDVLNGTAAPWAIFLALAFIRRGPALLLLLPVTVYGALSSVASTALGSDTANVLRFYVITVGTLLAFYIRPRQISAGFALSPLILQCMIIASVSLWLGFAQSEELGQLVRGYILETTWGDIYSFDGIYYRVQLIGNALVPLIFLISLWRYRQQRLYRVMTWVSFLGVFAAGNLTYVLVAGLGLAIRLWGHARKSVLTWLLMPLVFCAALFASWNGIQEAIDRKFDGTDSSMGVRFDQVDVAIESWKESPVKFLLGAGLGAPYPDGRERNYSEFQYIELQLLYLIYQLGALGIITYAATLVTLAQYCLDRNGRYIFWLYILSGSTNPTILDTNQIIATMMLVCLFPRIPLIGPRRQAEEPHGPSLSRRRRINAPILGATAPGS